MPFTSKTCCQLFKNCGIVRASTLFRPQHIVTEHQCISQKLMFRDGLTFPAGPGTLYFLPIFVRTLEKLVALVDSKMQEIGAQKIIMPCLTAGSLFKKSGRWETIGNELMKLKDRHGQDLCLGPTHEESATNLIASLPAMSCKNLPLMLYQVTTKFRDEGRPKFGAMRSREFIMKDLYTFDRDDASARVTYDRVCGAYEEIFKSLSVDAVKVRGSTGAMGGKHSDEFHLLSDIGEDNLLLCPRCNFGVNSDLETDSDSCSQCKTSLEHKRGIEVGHAFLLGTKYSDAFKAQFVDGSSKRSYVMGCYGLGVTRIVAAVVEVAAKGIERIEWPLTIAPFLISIIPPKEGSKEMEAEGLLPHLIDALCRLHALRGNLLLDDRCTMTIGKRLNELRNLGVPFAIVLGKKALEERPLMEVIDIYHNRTHFFTLADLVEFFRETFDGLFIKE